MTVAQQTALYAYTGDSVTTDFPFPSKILSAGDILVGVGGVLQTSGYSVLNVGVNEGGTVRFAAAPAAVRVVLLRKPPISQLVDFVNGQSTLDDTVENALDKLTMICQYLGFVLGRSVRLDDFDADDGSGLTLPPRAERISKALGFDSNGDLTTTITSLTQAEIDAIFAASAAAISAAEAAQAAASANTSVVDTILVAAGMTFEPATNYVRAAGYAAVNDIGLGGVVAKRAASEPAHPFKFSSNAGTVWWELEQPFKPEAIGHFPGDAAKDLSVLIGQLETTKPECTVYLSDGDWYTTQFMLGSSVRITGPGADRAMFHSTWHRIGRSQEDQRGVNPRVRALTASLNNGDGSPTPRFTAAIRNSALAIANGVTTDISFDADVDAMGGFRTAFFGGVYNPPGATRTYVFTPAEARAVRASGFVTFAPDANGARQISLVRNGAEFIADVTIPALAGGVTSTVMFDFGIISNTPYDNYSLRAYQSSGGLLNIIKANFTLEVVAADSRVVPDKPMKVFQGVWQDIEATYPTWRAFVEAMASYGVLVLSHPDVIGAPPNPWADPNRGKLIPGVATPEFPNVLDYGYKKFKRLLNDVKTLNPECLIFGYVSPGVDCEWVSSGGNPCKPSTMGAPGAFEDPLGSGNYWVNDKTWAPGGHPNFRQWVDLWTRDKSLPVDGFFLDHYANVFTSENVRDECTRICKSKGMKVMGNITFAAAANVTWAAACPFLSYGDYFALEGFYRDGALDTLAGTQDVIAEMHKLAPRGIWLCALCEEVPPIKGNPADFSKGASYYQVGTAVTITTNNSIGGGVAHGLVTGDKVYLDTGPGPLPSGLYTVTGSTAYTFTVVAPVGSVAVYGYLTVYPHGISKTEMNNNSVNNLNGRSLFNNYYIPGWVYDYGRTSVDTIGTPAI